MPGPRRRGGRSPKHASRRRPHVVVCLTAALSLGLLACVRHSAVTPADIGLVASEIYLADVPAHGHEGDFAGVLLLVNASAAPVRIDNVRTDCGCTAVDWPRGSAASGDTLRIPVVLDCRRSGLAEHEVEVWVRGRRAPLRAVVTAECP